MSTEPGPDEARLIDWQALVRADPAAVDAFVRSTIDRVHSMLYRMMGQKEEAEDLTQEVYMRAFRGLPSYRGEAAPETWLFRIAINVGRDAIARRQAERKREGGEVDPDLHASSADPAADTVEREDFRILRAALDALPDDRREMIVLADVEGLGMEEIGRILDMPPGTVKSRLHRTRETLREDVRRRMGEKR